MENTNVCDEAELIRMKAELEETREKLRVESFERRELTDAHVQAREMLTECRTQLKHEAESAKEARERESCLIDIARELRQKCAEIDKHFKSAGTEIHKIVKSMEENVGDDDREFDCVFEENTTQVNTSNKKPKVNTPISKKNSPEEMSAQEKMVIRIKELEESLSERKQIAELNEKITKLEAEKRELGEQRVQFLWANDQKDSMIKVLNEKIQELEKQLIAEKSGREILEFYRQWPNDDRIRALIWSLDIERGRFQEVMQRFQRFAVAIQNVLRSAKCEQAAKLVGDYARDNMYISCRNTEDNGWWRNEEMMQKIKEIFDQYKKAQANMAGESGIFADTVSNPDNNNDAFMGSNEQGSSNNISVTRPLNELHQKTEQTKKMSSQCGKKIRHKKKGVKRTAPLSTEGDTTKKEKISNPSDIGIDNDNEVLLKTEKHQKNPVEEEQKIQELVKNNEDLLNTSFSEVLKINETENNEEKDAEVDVEEEEPSSKPEELDDSEAKNDQFADVLKINETENNEENDAEIDEEEEEPSPKPKELDDSEEKNDEPEGNPSSCSSSFSVISNMSAISLDSNPAGDIS